MAAIVSYTCTGAYAYGSTANYSLSSTASDICRNTNDWCIQGPQYAPNSGIDWAKDGPREKELLPPYEERRELSKGGGRALISHHERLPTKAAYRAAWRAQRPTKRSTATGVRNFRS